MSSEHSEYLAAGEGAVGQRSGYFPPSPTGSSEGLTTHRFYLIPLLLQPSCSTLYHFFTDDTKLPHSLTFTNSERACARALAADRGAARGAATYAPTQPHS
eukprot:364420-Chlamydomonas_euryale.AAC.6